MATSDLAPILQLRGARASRPLREVKKAAGIQDDCRYWLKRTWDDGPEILWIGLNPSTADGQRDDPTMLREIAFSNFWGFGALLKLNMFPFISSSPRVLDSILAKRAAEKKVQQSILQNGAELRRSLKDASLVIAAWGNKANAAAVCECWQMIEELNLETKVACIGINSNGSPKHTLARGRNRVRDTQIPFSWRPPSQT